MPKKIGQIIFSFVLIASLFLPVTVSALSFGGLLGGGGNPNISSGLDSISNLFGPIGQGNNDVLAVIYVVIRIILYVVGAVAVLFIIIGGFWYVTSGGNEETAKKGKKTITNAIIGIVIIILSYAIVNVIVVTIS